MMGSVPGLLDSISSYGSTADILAASNEDEPAVPNILTECIRHLEANGFQTVGIFRVSPSKKRVRQVRGWVSFVHISNGAVCSCEKISIAARSRR